MQEAKKIKVDYLYNLKIRLTAMDIFKPLDLQKDAWNNTNIEIIEKVRCLIIGSGPAGYTAAIYA